MFGKRAKNQPTDQDQDFEGSEAEFAEDFASQDQPEEAAWGDDQLDNEEGLEPELRDRRRSPLSKVLPFAALGVIAAGGAGYYYLNYMQAPVSQNPVIAAAPAEPEVTATAPIGEAAPVGEPVFATTPLDTPTEATAETAVPMVAGAPEIVASDTAMLEPAEPVAAEPEAVAPAPTDIQPELTPEISLEPAPAQPEPEAVAAIEAPAPVETAPVETAPVETAAVEPAPVVTAPVVTAPVVTAPVEAPVAATTSPTTNAASENLADMSGRMDVLERQIEDLTKAVDNLATQGSGTTTPAVDAELKSTVTALQDQVRKLQSELSAVRTAPTASPTPAVTASTEPAPARPVATRSTPAPRAATETPRSRPAAAPAAPVRWVLRAAQSNEAWVSRSSEGELRSVAVGQSLEGIGRITAIRQSGNGGWEVIGTQGSLRQ